MERRGTIAGAKYKLIGREWGLSAIGSHLPGYRAPADR